jgi:multiple sugar transport system permease protein
VKNLSRVSWLKVLLYAILTLYAIITLIPFLWALLASFKPLFEIVSGESNFLPKNLTFDNYKQIFVQESLFVRWLFNGWLCPGKAALSG